MTVFPYKATGRYFFCLQLVPSDCRINYSLQKSRVAHLDALEEWLARVKIRRGLDMLRRSEL